ncbi:hypothetical protein L484_001508 [Morus notabilis]|uniref:Uncharacterized protein n=1 Tax=Morus notabilis TaxID=981085 RepID=W9SI14_9ROSA|nr:hypothetical protein L484_001508 [Morus notabilis]
MATSFGVVMGLVSRYIDALFVIYDSHGNGDNFWCPNGVHRASKLSSRSKTGTGTATTFGVVTGPVIRYIDALFDIYDSHGNGDNFWCPNGAKNLSDRSSLRTLQAPREG